MIPSVFLQATKREILFARALWQTDYLLHSIHLNLGKTTLPIYHEQRRRMAKELDSSYAELCNYVGPMSEGEFGEAMETWTNKQEATR